MPIMERALGGELTHHLGYPPGGARPEDTTNHRNGTGSKTVLTDDGLLPLDVPRNREGTCEPCALESDPPGHVRVAILDEDRFTMPRAYNARSTRSTHKTPDTSRKAP